jgi:class 3 adenylate cyclase
VSRNPFSVQSKLVVAFLLVALGTAAAILWVLLETGRGALEEAAEKQLTAIAAARKQEVEDRLRDFRRQLGHLAETTMFVDAMRELPAAYRKLDGPLPPGAADELERFYREDFGRRLAKFLDGGEPAIDPLLPDSDPGRYLQYRYIAANPNAFDTKAALDDAGDGSQWSALHRRFHPLFRRVVDRFGYEDLLLVDPEGTIVYSTFKRPDFATSLERGPYRESNLAELVRTLKANPDRGAVVMIDFARYRPALRQPVAFIGTPIYEGKKLLGFLVAGVPVGVLNEALTAAGEWEAQGLGKTGETYLVGPDHLFRSRSRFMMQDPKGFPEELLKAGVAPDVVEQIRKFDNVILLLPTRAAAANRAVAGERGVVEGVNYRNATTLTAYAPVTAPGIRWALLADMDLSEALAARDALQRRIILVAGALLLAVITLATWLARRFTRPVQEIAAAAQQLAAGDQGASVPARGNDEFGELGRAFNALSAHVAELRDERDAGRRRSGELVRSLVPSAAVNPDGALVAESDVRQAAATVVCVRLERTGTAAPPVDALDAARELVGLFDDAAREQGLDTLHASGDDYVAVAGLTAGRLDDVVRAADFALEIRRVAQRFALAHDQGLQVRIGIDTGTAAGGLAGHGRVRYLLAGAPVEGARAAAAAAEPGAVLVTHGVRQALGSAFACAADARASGLFTLAS